MTKIISFFSVFCGILLGIFIHYVFHRLIIATEPFIYVVF